MSSARKFAGGVSPTPGEVEANIPDGLNRPQERGISPAKPNAKKLLSWLGYELGKHGDLSIEIGDATPVSIRHYGIVIGRGDTLEEAMRDGYSRWNPAKDIGELLGVRP